MHTRIETHRQAGVSWETDRQTDRQTDKVVLLSKTCPDKKKEVVILLLRSTTTIIVHAHEHDDTD